ncbi:MAG TPA: hypothetical protein VJL58_00475, partial [Pyrinomonadaceae bacterium]|nr:hypothetical protein [Pyrinomonadaceae bacterium]
MLYLYFFHNVFGTGDPVTDLIFGLIVLGISFISTYFVVYGIYSLIRYWEFLDRRLKPVFALAPIWAMAIVFITSDHGFLLSFPFGVFSGIPVWILISLAFGSEHWIPDLLLPYFGLLINLCGALGVARRISQL